MLGEQKLGLAADEPTSSQVYKGHLGAARVLHTCKYCHMFVLLVPDLNLGPFH
jgi:hypothetical protein